MARVSQSRELHTRCMGTTIYASIFCIVKFWGDQAISILGNGQNIPYTEGAPSQLKVAKGAP